MEFFYDKSTKRHTRRSLGPSASSSSVRNTSSRWTEGRTKNYGRYSSTHPFPNEPVGATGKPDSSTSGLFAADTKKPYRNYEVCNNCGKYGHTFKQCKNPITSYGVIMFRINPSREREYLMIRRKDTLGFVDLMRGKYSASNHKYVLNMLEQMTDSEKKRLLSQTFDELWSDLWKGESTPPLPLPLSQPIGSEVESTREGGGKGDGITWREGVSVGGPSTPVLGGNCSPTGGVECPSPSYKQEEATSKEKFHYLSTKKMSEVVSHSNWPFYFHTWCKERPNYHPTVLEYLVECTSIENHWEEPEWGFPKGRRNYQEKDYDCALREMTEETGYPIHLVRNIKNILPFDENFLGSNYKSYKHKYYLMYMDYQQSLCVDKYDKSEVSMMKWKTYEECLESIRPYNLEKKRLMANIEATLSKYIG